MQTIQITILFICIFIILIFQFNLIAEKYSGLQEYDVEIYRNRDVFYFLNNLITVEEIENFFPFRVSSEKLYAENKFPVDYIFFNETFEHVQNIFYEKCNKDTEVIFVVFSDPSNFIFRQQIRGHFGKNKNFYNYEWTVEYPFDEWRRDKILHCFLFSVGYRDDKNLNFEVDIESFLFKDVLRVPVYDSYKKLSNKVIATLVLLNNIQHDYAKIVKLDDDVLVKINKMVPLVVNLNKFIRLAGNIISNTRPIRDKNHKWYLGKKVFPDDVIFPYLEGSCYLIRRNIIEKMSLLHTDSKIIPIEPIHMGFLYNSWGFEIVPKWEFKNCKDSICNNTFVVHMGKNMKERIEILEKYKTEYD